MRRSYLVTTVLAVSVTVLNCDDWSTMDDVFTRWDVAGSRGWTGGDGAIGIRLPDGSDRTLWIFGDSAMTGVDGNGLRVYFPGGAALANTIFGNTIAIQDHSLDADPAQIRFYAREATAGCTALPGAGSTCPVADVTRLASDGGQGFFEFFDYRLLKLAPHPSGAGFLWPSGGVCLNCDSGAIDDDRLLLSFTEIRFCNPTQDASCTPMCAFSGEPNPPTCTAGVNVLGTVLGRIENPTAPLGAWIGSSTRVAGPIAWASLLQDGGTLYFFGTRDNPAPNPDLTKLQKHQLVLAKAAVGDALNQSRWSYWKGGAFVPSATTPAPTTLDKVANVEGLPSVTKITRHGESRFVLLNDNPFVDHFVYARVSASPTVPTSFPDVTPTTPRAEIAAFDRTLSNAIVFRPFFGSCPFPSTPNSYRTCGLNYHVLAHPHISFQDPQGISSLVFSYIIPQPVIPGPQNAIDTYRPKFGFLPLDNLRPWCSLANQPCWEGINWQFSVASLTRGQESAALAFDVRKATRFQAALITGSGDPDIYVQFGTAPTTSSFACRPFGTTIPETCDVAVPAGQTTAYVMVRGFTDASYALRVHYAGD
jgi:hypothetical protein